MLTVQWSSSFQSTELEPSGSSYPINWGSKILDGKFKKQLLSFKLHIVLSCVMTSCTILLHPTQDANPPFVLRNHTTCATHPLVTQYISSYQFHCCGITVLVFKEPFFYLTMAPKHQSTEAGNSDMLKRSHKVLQKVKANNMFWERPHSLNF